MGGDLKVREGVRGRHLEEVIFCENVLDLAITVNYGQTRNFQRDKQINSLRH